MGKKRFHLCILFCVLAPLILSGCARKIIQRKLASVEESKKLFPLQGKDSSFLKAHMKDGSVYLLKSWSYNDSALALDGTGNLLDLNRKTVKEGIFSIPYAGVAIIESNRLDSRALPLGGIWMMTGLTAIGAVYCVANPKACFGSCPTFYAWDGSQMTLQAEGFSASIAPALEAEDVDALYRARPHDRVFPVHVKNEALETHVIKDVHIAMLPRPPGGRVFKTGSDEYLQATNITAPVRVTAGTIDRTALFQMADGQEYWSLADSLNLAVRETLDVRFNNPSLGPFGLVIASRQTLMTTFLLYQTLAYMGSGVGYWLAELERGGTDAKQRACAYGDVLGKIEVLVDNGKGEWVVVGRVGETGPIVSDLYVVPLNISSLGKSALNLKLRMTRGYWRVDYLALATLGDKVLPVVLEANNVFCVKSEYRQVGTRTSIASNPLVQFPGDESLLTFLLPDDYSKQELFISSKGYYLEWIRSDWILEESPEKTMEFLTDPTGYLISMAPLYKKAEPYMEEQFWRSRYERAQ